MAKKITDSIEVIRWYQHQIDVKVMRALAGVSDVYHIPASEERPLDAEGSAKVALVGMDDSLMHAISCGRVSMSKNVLM